MSLGTLLERAYVQHADAPALLDDRGSVTYGELGRRVHRLVARLRRLGVGRGDRVVLLSANRSEFVEVEQACFVGGFVRVALSHRLHPEEVAWILGDCRPRALFVDGPWVGRAAGLRERCPSVEHVVAFGAPAPGTLAYEEELAAADPEPPGEPPEPDDLAALLYTSGTTGRPKGAMLTHANWVAMVRNSMVELAPIDETDVVLDVAPLSHLAGYVATTYFVRGARHVVLPEFDPVSVLDALARHRVTAVALVPTMLNLLVLAAESAGAGERPLDVAHLRTVLYAGSPIAPDRLVRASRVFGDVFVQFYGLSETPMPLTCLSAADHRRALDGAEGGRDGRLGSAGRPNPFVELVVAGPDGAVLPPGEVGEVRVRGDTVMAGYWDNPAATAAMVDAAGWAATGDLGVLDADGYLTLVDRKNDLIISGGYNVYPSEVEHAISALPEVLEVAVVGVPDETWGESVAAFVVVRPGHELRPDQVLAACGERLAAYKKPRAVHLVAELPKTGSGKIQRRRVKEGAWGGRERRVGG